MSTAAPRPVRELDSTTLHATSHSAASPVMTMLSHHVPLTLLLDLALGVRSSEVFLAEQPDLSWLTAAAASRAG